MAKTRTALLCSAALLAAGANVAAQETFVRADIDRQGQLRIVSSRGHEIVPARHKDQVGFDKAAISPDRRAVGWLALFPNCCTTYPIPLELVVYMKGRERKFTGVRLAFGGWAFSGDGKRVAFEQETVHGGLGVHYELRDVSTGRLVAVYDPCPAKPRSPPAWVQALDAGR